MIDSSVILLQNVLTLTNLQRSDAGKWIVVANNSIDKSEASVEVRDTDCNRY